MTNMEVNGLGEETNDGFIFNLFFGGVNGPSCRSEILSPTTRIVNTPNVVSRWRIHLPKQGQRIRTIWWEGCVKKRLKTTRENKKSLK